MTFSSIARALVGASMENVFITTFKFGLSDAGQKAQPMGLGVAEFYQ